MKNREAAYLEKIEQALEKVLPEPEAAVLQSTVIQAMRYSLLLGGKRVRPMLTLAFCELCGGSMESAMPFACAVEMVHTYSLIHDDMPCMDNDDLRRGKPTNHKVFGEAMALLAGDGLLTKAFEVALSSGLDAGVAVRGTRILAACAGDQGMVGGQCVDLEADGKTVDLSVLQEMHSGKTVALIAAACCLGCIAAGGTEKQLEAARRYAQGVGMAFQIRDDILDVLGSPEKLGKNVGVDQKHQKRNYVSLLGVTEAQHLVEEYTGQALNALKDFSGDTEFLANFAESLAVREH